MADDVRDVLEKELHELPPDSEWRWQDDVFEFHGGAQPAASTFVSEPRPGYVRLIQIRDYYTDSHLTFVPESPKLRLCSPDDVMIARYGSSDDSRLDNSLGRVCRGLAGAYNVALAKATPASDVNKRFLFYLLKSSYFQQPLRGQGARSVQAGFNRESLSVIALPVPPIDEQRAVAHILGTLDSKIGLNRRMSETLETMARGIFKSWFVDFDPVRANAEGRGAGLPPDIADLFPDRFEDPGSKDVPLGWEAAAFSELVELVRDQENPLDSPEAVFSHYSIPAFDDGQRPRGELGANIKSLKFRVPEGVVLLSKLNPDIERVWLVDTEPAARAVCSTEFLVLRPRPPFSRSYVYCLARSAGFREALKAMVTGTSKSHQRAQADPVLNLAVPIPPAPVVRAFDRFVAIELERALACRRESGTLAALRDALLPKLISGELRVTDAARIAAGDSG